MSLAFITSARPSIHGQLKLAKLFQMSEREFEARVRSIEDREGFRRLVALGVVSIQPYQSARFSARRFAGRELRGGNDGLSGVLDGRDALVKVISGIGQEAFERYFLRDEGFSDVERAQACGISAASAREIRGLVDRLYVESEFQDPSANAAPEKVYSAVAGFAIEQGKPVLAFFNREVWKGRYRVDEEKREQLLSALGAKEAAGAQRLLSELEFVERRKSTLFRVLEEVLNAQAEYLVSGDLGRRRALTQRDVAAKLNILPSVLNRLISNKSVQLPWGLEAPLKVFMPSPKAVGRDRLYEIAVASPGLSDEGLRVEMRRRHGANLSRRSIAQYRQELGLQARGLRPGSTSPRPQSLTLAAS